MYTTEETHPCLFPERKIITVGGKILPVSIWLRGKVKGFCFVKRCSSAPPPVRTAALTQKTLALVSIATSNSGSAERKQALHFSSPAAMVWL